MEKNVHRQLLTDALKALVDERLNDAHIIMRSLCRDCNDTDLLNRLDSIESDYRAMIDFIAMGGHDPERDKNFHALVSRSFLLFCAIQRELLLSPYLPQINEISCADLITSYWVPSPQAFETLLDSIQSEDDYQPLIGVILACMLHPEMLRFYPQLRRKVIRLFKDGQFHDTILHIYTEIVLSCQAERIEQHMKDEMMPIMIEASKDRRLQQEMTEEMTNADEEMDSFEKMMKQHEQVPLTPEQRKKKKLLNSAMQELMDIHNEGIDINTEIFNFAAHLPFFSHMPNWFADFDPHNPAIEDICYPNGRPNIMFRMLFDVPSLCDIDKYAMTLILGKKLKTDKMSHLISDLQNIIAESESLKGMDFVLPQKTTKEKISDFIHTLYRFVTKSQWKDDLPNVFVGELPFCDDEVLSLPLTIDPQAALTLGDKMWRFGARAEAVKMYQFVERINGELDFDHNLKIATFYSGTFSHLGIIHAERAYALDPENIKAISLRADIHVYMEQWQEAIQLFYKLEYLEKKVLYAQRGIVECSLHLGKFDVALRYSRKIFNTTNSATWMDYLRAGHAAWLSDDMTSALTFYHLYLKHYLRDDATITDALTPFNDDEPFLYSLGKTPIDVALMRDMITLKSI